MGCLAFVFAGQGDQFPGMGKDLRECSPAAANVFGLFESVRPGTLSQCFDGPDEVLRRTSNVQPCLFAYETAAHAVLKEHGIEPDMLAGFSLGELAAVTAAGVFDLETGFRLACERGRLMELECNDAFMGAVLGMDHEEVDELCEHIDGVYPANYNCPGQTVVSGIASQRNRLSREVRDRGGRLVPLKVQGGFHSPLMEPAARAFEAVLESVPTGKPDVEVYSNVTATSYGDPRELLAAQISSPVKWEQTIRNMIRRGCDRFVEVGPKTTLANLIARIDPDVEVFSLSDLDLLWRKHESAAATGTDCTTDREEVLSWARP